MHKQPLIDQLPPSGIEIASHRHEKSGAVQRHAHPYPSLVVVTDGLGGCFLGEQDFPLNQDMAVLIPANVAHETYDHPGHPMNVFSVGFSKEHKGISDLAFSKLMNTSKPLNLPVYAAKQIQQLLRSLLHEQNLKAPEYEVAMSSSLSSLLVQLYRCLDKQPTLGTSNFDSIHKVREVLRDLELNYHEHNSLGDAARLAHLSQRQFSNLCHQITGFSYVAWINNIRCNKAKEYLTQTSMPISSIAFEVGFEELSTFYRAFKKNIGVAPRTFRQNQHSE